MSNRDERRMILLMIEEGKITPEEGLGLLKALGESEYDASDRKAAFTVLESEFEQSGFLAESNFEASIDGHAPKNSPQVLEGSVETPLSSHPAPDKWRSWWMYPLWIGVVVTIFGGLLMYWAQQSFGIGFWFVCAWVPFSIGLLLMVIALQSRSSRWLHLRVYQKPGEWPRKMAISLPIGWAGWLVNLIKGKVPSEELAKIDAFMQAVNETTSPESPLIIEVDEGGNSERVEIYIG